MLGDVYHCPSLDTTNNPTFPRAGMDGTDLATGIGGSAASAKQAFEAARRAIIRCGSSGYDLPEDKYGQWKEIEMTFNPERMRIK